MAGFAELKKLFFDSDMVVKRLDEKTRKALSKAGSFIRQRARSSIKKSRQKSDGEMTDAERKAYAIRCSQAKRLGKPKPKRPLARSQPGEPPRSPTGIYKRTIFYYYDSATNSVVAGPMKLDKSKDLVPAILESGGTEIKGDGKTVYIQPRPHMKPAFDKERPNISSLFAGDI